MVLMILDDNSNEHHVAEQLEVWDLSKPEHKDEVCQLIEEAIKDIQETMT